MSESRPPFRAKFKSTCAYAANGQCKLGGTIIPGQEIRWSRTIKGRAWHADCGLEGPSSAPPVPSMSYVPEEPTAPPEPVERQDSTAEPPSGDLVSALVAAVAPHIKAQAAVDEKAVKAIVEKAIAPLQEAINAVQAPTRIEVKRPDSPEIIDCGVQHCQFPVLLKTLEARQSDGHRLNVWLAGPAGSGKTTAAQAAAKALGLEFAFTGAIDTPYPLLGFIDAGGNTIKTPFRKVYENGGVFLFDEYDGSAPAATLPFNAALANGHCAFPDAIVQRHPDFIAIAAANTFGMGATAEYVGRNRLDAASLDRFVSIAWKVDEALELATAGNTAWVSRVQTIRRNVARQGIRVIISPRASYFGAALLAAGMAQAEVETLVLRKGMPDDQWRSIA